MKLDRDLEAEVAHHLERHSQLMNLAARLVREGRMPPPNGSALLLLVAAVKHQCDAAIAESQAQLALRRAQNAARQTSAPAKEGLL